MSNDNRFERVVKLWISVWNLILEQKRHLETVTTILQRIVFEAHGYPKFKDWVAICQLSGTNNYIMKAVGMLDLSKVDTDPTVRQLIAAFPQCFSSEEIQGPIPLSIIFEMAQRAGQKKNKYDITGSQFPVSHNVIPHWIPVKIFKIPSDSSDSKISLVPEVIYTGLPQGKIIMFEGNGFIVLESNLNRREVIVAPAEYIYRDVSR